MSHEALLAVIFLGIATYLSRLLPYLWMRKRLNSSQGTVNQEERIPQSIRVLGPIMIAAMFGMSLLPQEPKTPSLLAAPVACFFIFYIWKKKKSLIFPILGGVASYGLTLFILRNVLY